MAAALRGVRTVICTGRLGALLPAAAAAGVEHIVLLTSAGKFHDHMYWDMLAILIASVAVHGGPENRCTTVQYGKGRPDVRRIFHTE